MISHKHNYITLGSRTINAVLLGNEILLHLTLSFSIIFLGKVMNAFLVQNRCSSLCAAYPNTKLMHTFVYLNYMYLKHCTRCPYLLIRNYIKNIYLFNHA